MKEDFLRVMKDLSRIESQFHDYPRPHGFVVPYEEQIGDVPDFQIWIQRVQKVLLEMVDRTGDDFARKALEISQSKFNGWHDRSTFMELKNKLLVIQEDADKYYPSGESEGDSIVSEKKAVRIFISHATDDKPYVKHVVRLLEGMGLNQTHIFCSSLPGYDIPIDLNIFDYLRQQFADYNLWVMFVHSPKYYTRPICLNEMGAAWVLRSKHTSFLLPGFDYGEMTGVVNNREIAIKLDNDRQEVRDKLNQFYNNIVSEFGLSRLADILWEERRDAFIDEINKLGPVKSNTDDTDKTEDSNDDMEMIDGGLFIKKSEVKNGKSIYYCPACYIKLHQAFPVIQMGTAPVRVCCNCKTSYKVLR